LSWGHSGKDGLGSNASDMEKAIIWKMLKGKIPKGHGVSLNPELRNGGRKTAPKN